MSTLRRRLLLYGIAGFLLYGFMLIAGLLSVTHSLFYPSSRVLDRIASYSLFPAFLFCVACWLLYLWDVFHNPRMPRDKRALWDAVLFLAGPWAMPFYFWFYVRPGTAHTFSAPTPPEHSPTAR
jgi:hypothetical protein